MTDKKGLPLDEEQFIKYYETLDRENRDKEIAKLAFRTYIKFDEVVSKEDCKNRLEKGYSVWCENLKKYKKEDWKGKVVVTKDISIFLGVLFALAKLFKLLPF